MFVHSVQNVHILLFKYPTFGLVAVWFYFCVLFYFLYSVSVFLLLAPKRKIVCGDAQKPDDKTVTSTPAMLYFPRGDGSNQTCATDLLLAPALQ